MATEEGGFPARRSSARQRPSLTSRRRFAWLSATFCTLAAWGVTFSPKAASAQADTEPFRGKVLRVLVSTSPGGGYDARARMLARHLGRFLPGAPTGVAENLPGGGGVTSLNYIYNLAPRDGTALLVFQRTAITAPILSPSGIRFDLAKFNWLGGMGPDNGYIVTSRESPIQKTEDVFTKETILASASLTPIPIILNALIGSKFKVITGYPGSGETMLAMQRGEVMGISEWSWSDLRQSALLAGGKVNLLLQTGRTPVAETPDVPLALKYAKSPEDRRLLEAFVSPRDVAYPLVMPPDMPAERVALMRKAFTALGADAEFKADMAKLGLDFTFQSGADVEALVNELTTLPPDMQQRMRTLADLTQGR